MKQTKLNGRMLGMALLIMICGTLIICAMVGLLVEKQVIPERMGWLLALGATELVVFAVASLHAHKVPQGRMTMALIMAALFITVRLLSGIVLFHGEGIRLWGCLTTFGAAVTAGLSSSTKRQRRR